MAKKRQKADPNSHLSGQIIGAGVDAEKASRLAAETAAISAQDRAYAAASDSIDQVRKFVGSPEHILGNPDTKHGEIAEHAQVAIDNSNALLQQQSPSSTFDGVSRTDPADYLRDGVFVQSKYINGLNKNLQHVLDHLRQYPDFGRGEEYYHIPKNHFNGIMEVVRNNEYSTLNTRSIAAIQDKISRIEASTGRDFTDVVRPGALDYAAVQQGKIHTTLDECDNSLKIRNEELKQEIYQEHQASLGGAIMAAGGGAAVGAGIRLVKVYFDKKNEGRDLFKGEFTTQDWQDFGLQGVGGAVQGGVSGAAIYALTNATDMAAPFAAAFVTSGIAIGRLAYDYKQGRISQEELVENGLVVCLEGGIVALTTIAGQTLIPVPILGSVLGAVSGRVLVAVGRNVLGQADAQLWEMLEARLDQAQSATEHKYLPVFQEITAKFDYLEDLSNIAFDLDNNCSLVRLSASINMARHLNVPEEEIMRKYEDLDRFIVGNGSAS